jgi:hypothetical protein
VVFNERRAFCTYDCLNPPQLRLIDAVQKTAVSVPLETPIRCAIVGCHDDHLFYIRLLKSKHVLGLFQRSIQGNGFGKEVLLQELGGMGYKANYDIACREKDHGHHIIVISTEGKCQSHEIDFESRRMSPEI